MVDRRVLLAALTTLVLVASPCVPAFSDEPNPTLAERQAAQNRVTVAKRSVATLQARAEHAVEVHNGQLLKAQRAVAASRTAQAAAREARDRHDVATAVTEKAQTEAAEAATHAGLAAGSRAQAEVRATDSQRQLDAMAAGAFRGAGTLGMLSQILDAHDPLELMKGHDLINRVADHQSAIITTLQGARASAVVASMRAAEAHDRAATSADRAQASLAIADQTRRSAERAGRVEAAAAHVARQALEGAIRSKARARSLVARAEAVLHRAKRTSASLERAAAAARRAAAAVQVGRSPSDAASTAIRWAMKQAGVPYSWGGGDESGPTRGFAQGANTVGFDCSGLTLFAYAKAGIRLEHWTGSQYYQGKRISSRKDLLPGDLMYFAYDTGDPSTIHHMSMYLGDGRMVEAPYTGEVVRVSPSSRTDFIGATRPWA